MSWAAVASLVRASAQSSSSWRRARPAYPSPPSSTARVRLAMIVASRSPVEAAAAATSFLKHEVVGQPPQMPCPGDLADVAQLQRSAILLNAPLGAVPIDCREAQPNLGFLFGRRHLRERRNGQLFGLVIAAGAVEQPHRFGDQLPVLRVIGGQQLQRALAHVRGRTGISVAN